MGEKIFGVQGTPEEIKKAEKMMTEDEKKQSMGREEWEEKSKLIDKKCEDFSDAILEKIGSSNITDFVNEIDIAYTKLRMENHSNAEARRQIYASHRSYRGSTDESAKIDTEHSLPEKELAEKFYASTQITGDKKFDFIPDDSETNNILANLTSEGKERFPDYDWNRIHTAIMNDEFELTHGEEFNPDKFKKTKE